MVAFGRRFRVLLLLAVGLLIGLLATRAFLPHPTKAVQLRPQGIDWSFTDSQVKVCEAVVPNVSMSQSYQIRQQEFQRAVNGATASGNGDGYSAQLEGQYRTMHYLAQHSHVKTACETGFNLGHSAFNYLTANDRLIVHSFDIGDHAYAHEMAKYLTEKFPDRFFIHFGDSTQTVPEFIRQNPGFRCDYIFVDGGHSYPVALADIDNFAKIANLDENVILFDDYPTIWGLSFGKAWDNAIRTGVVRERLRCTFIQAAGLQRGFTIGHVIKRPAL